MVYVFRLNILVLTDAVKVCIFVILISTLADLDSRFVNLIEVDAVNVFKDPVLLFNPFMLVCCDAELALRWKILLLTEVVYVFKLNTLLLADAV